MQSLTLLQAVQEVSRRHGIIVPSGVVASTDETILQLWGMANETMEELNERYKWPQLFTRYSFNHGGGTNYLALVTSGPSAVAAVADWRSYVPRTLWDDTAGLELIGPVTEKDWQAAVNLNISAGRYMYRFYGTGLYIFPKPTVLGSVTFRLEYYSSGVITDSTGATVKDSFTADTDICRIPSRLLVQGIRWRYKKEKGLPYAEDKDTYELSALSLSSNTGQQQELDMGGEGPAPGPMIIVPPGSWPV